MASPRPTRPGSSRRIGWLLPPLVFSLVLLVLWQVGVALFEIQEWLLPSPWQIVQAGLQARPLLWPHIWQTTQETVLGFLAALIIGLGLGILIDFSAMLRAAIYPLLVLSQTVPIIAIAPLLVIWFGYGIMPKIIVVGLVCFFPIVVSTADGLRSADPEQIALLRTMGASRWGIFSKVQLPGAMPMVFTGIKVGVTYSVVGAILGEWVGASRGLGVFMLRATSSFRTDWVFVTIVIVAALSMTLFGLVTLAERIVLYWYYAAMRTEDWKEVRRSK